MRSIGGKARNLAILKEQGLVVPEYVVVDNVQLERTMKPSKLAQFVSIIEKGSFDKNTESKISSLINETNLENILGLETFSNFINTHKLFAVRSSNSLEDGKHSSWAGIFESVLNVSKSNIPDAMRRCWASTFSEISYLYCTQVQKRDFADLKPNIIIQKMISAKVSGIAFSKNPTFDNDERIFVEFVQGTGDALASGHVNPKSTYLTRDKSSNETILPFPAYELVDGLVKMECQLQCSVDIEWTWDGSTLYFLQVRPVTA